MCIRSGSGKTTLLAAISQRLRGNISGTISLNGSLVRQTEMADRSSFIPQFDVSSEFLTVYEHMCFVYKLKNCAALGPKNAYIHGILRSLGLNKVAQSRIQVLSGGERKKLLLATEVCYRLFHFSASGFDLNTFYQSTSAAYRSKHNFL